MTCETEVTYSQFFQMLTFDHIMAIKLLLFTFLQIQVLKRNIFPGCTHEIVYKYEEFYWSILFFISSFVNIILYIGPYVPLLQLNWMLF